MPYGLIASDSITDSSGGVLAPSSSVFRNRILNGDMRIDQRNAGASVTPANSGADYIYTLDRWRVFSIANSKFSVQQNAASVTPPVGFSNYLGVTSLAATTVGSTDVYVLGQRIEGFNFADMAWGTANAATITLSFWVRSSLTGTFGGALNNSAVNRSYPFTYTISSANTWEQKSITVAGDTSGTWIGSTNGVGCSLQFGLGVGSTNSGTAGAWAGAAYLSATGATSVVGTSGATFYITGVQLEKGTTATSFDYRDYGRELAMCQRYYGKSYAVETAIGTATTTGLVGLTATVGGATWGAGYIPFKASMRTAPTISYWDGAGNASKISYTSAVSGTYSFTNNITPAGAPNVIGTFGFSHPGQSSVANVFNYLHFGADSEL
jgi:hypothetical protein